MTLWMLLAMSAAEVLLLIFLVIFFFRLKRSENLLSLLQQKQEDLVAKLNFSSELEQELLASFQQRQSELIALDETLESRAQELTDLVERAEKISKAEGQSPHQAVINGHKRGLSVKALAHSTGLATHEVELILMEAAKRNKL